MTQTQDRIPEEKPPKRIVERLGRLGNEYAWLERMTVDWGDGVAKETFVANLPEGAFVLPILDDGSVLLVRQYRLFNDGWRYEIPGGIIDEGETPEEAARRELEEEGGYAAQRFKELLVRNIAPSMPCSVHLFVASGLTRSAQRLDEAERGLTVHEMSVTRLFALIADGTITDTNTILAALLAKERGILKTTKDTPEKKQRF